MAAIKVNEISDRSLLVLGRVGENEFRPVTIDVSAWLTAYPSGEITAVFKRPDGQTYPVDITVSAGIVTWLPNSTDLSVDGDGRYEMRITSGTTAGKSKALKTYTEPSLSGGAVPQPPMPDCIASAIQAGKDAVSAKESAQGYAAQTASDKAAAAASKNAAADSAAIAAQKAADIVEAAATAIAKATEAGDYAAAAALAKAAAILAQVAAETAQAAAEAAQGRAETAASGAENSETNAQVSATTAAQALADLLALLGSDIPVAVNGKIPMRYIPATATQEIYPVTSEAELTGLTAQRGDLAELIETIDGEATITKTWQCLGDATDRSNWVVWGTSYAVQAGSASLANAADDATKINGHRIVEMTETQFASAVKDATTYYLVYPEAAS